MNILLSFGGKNGYTASVNAPCSINTPQGEIHISKLGIVTMPIEAVIDADEYTTKVTRFDARPFEIVKVHYSEDFGFSILNNAS